MLKDYIIAKSTEDVIKSFSLYAGNCRVIAGGTDLILDLKSEKITCDHLIDINKIESLKKIQLKDGEILIGAGVTHNEVNKSDLINEKGSLLAKACGTVGSLQIRNTATLVGNVVKAQPAADGAVALVALDAMAQVEDSNGTKYIAVKDMYSGLSKSVIDSTSELVTHIKFKALQKNQGSSFVRLSQRNALALPMLNVAVVLSLNEDNSIDWARIVMSPVGPKPTRATKAEDLLKGSTINNELIIKASKLAAKDAHPRSSSLRGSAEYRKEVLETLIQRALKEALSEAGLDI
ncbi:MAG: FAD binding domain-containing protein [Anaeromicrobium sp.]|uniref:FAD binding domain-containing protein n=1 Tax=Anaeromicrobium sp. TaxID=1929132 RepID=UPI0025F39F7F|nr:FAD binding domain-containing protein [Anaeromicrobium sp.]MCT4595247.1 FAD binding domain-containing protein [Anaeromicrobium sp.]